jgi:hypothetical protein
VLDFSEAFYGKRDGKLLFDDPQLRFTIEDLFHTKIEDNMLRSSMLISASAPVSDMSRSRSSWGGLSVAASPRMHFHGTPYTLMASYSVKSSFFGKQDSGGALISTRMNAGVQGSYRMSRFWDAGLMLHANAQFGPDLPVIDPEMIFKDRGTQMFGLMPSLKYQLTQTVSLTSRLNWYFDTPVRATTVSLAAMMRLI